MISKGTCDVAIKGGLTPSCCNHYFYSTSYDVTRLLSSRVFKAWAGCHWGRAKKHPALEHRIFFESSRAGCLSAHCPAPETPSSGRPWKHLGPDSLTDCHCFSGANQSLPSVSASDEAFIVSFRSPDLKLTVKAFSEPLPPGHESFLHLKNSHNSRVTTAVSHCDAL